MQTSPPKVKHESSNSLVSTPETFNIPKMAILKAVSSPFPRPIILGIQPLLLKSDEKWCCPRLLFKPDTLGPHPLRIEARMPYPPRLQWQDLWRESRGLRWEWPTHPRWKSSHRLISQQAMNSPEIRVWTGPPPVRVVIQAKSQEAMVVSFTPVQSQ